MASVKLENIRKEYDGGVVAVKDVNIDIADKEFVVLVGPSGCGKSTTLRMIAGLEDISSGTISIDGTIVNEVPPKDRDIAMVFQNYALYPHMTVYENMAFGLKLRKYPKAEDREPRARSGADSRHRRISGPKAESTVGRAATARGSWEERLSASRRFFFSMNPSATSTRNCASKCEPRYQNCTTAFRRRWST